MDHWKEHQNIYNIGKVDNIIEDLKYFLIFDPRMHPANLVLTPLESGDQ